MIKTLTLGYAGEYGARMMAIDLSEEAAMWPDAAAQLLLVRPGEHTPYPADNAVYADGCMTFTPTKADMAIAGQGYAQVYFYGADGNVLGKSSMMVTHILPSLGGDSTEPPSGDELGYYDKLMQQAALAIAAGESAKEDAQSAAESAAKAEAALEEMKNISTQSGNMPDGGSPGQILAKKSAENYDTHWIDPPSGSGTGGGVADSVAWGNVTDKPSTYPPAAHTHPEYLGKNETAANANQLNGKSAEYYLQQYQFIDNPEMKIAQAGHNEYHGSELYLADRWPVNSSGVQIDADNKKITFSGDRANLIIVQQRFSPNTLKAGETVTVAVKAKSVTGNILLSDVGAQAGHDDIKIMPNALTTHTFVVGDSCAVVIWSAEVAELEYEYIIGYKGTYTADNLPPYVSKGYAAELAECSRWYTCGTLQTARPFAMGSNTMAYLCDVKYPVPMEVEHLPAKQPTVNISNVKIWVDQSDAGVSAVKNIGDNTGFNSVNLSAGLSDAVIQFDYEASADL